MFLTASVVFCLTFQKLVIADDSTNRSNNVTMPASYIISIIFGSALVTLIGTILTYTTLKCMRKRSLKSGYSVDDIPKEIDFSENEKNMYYEIPNLHQVQPIITISEVFVSMKQAFEDLGEAIIPDHWVRRKQMVDQETQIQQSDKLPI